MHRWVYSFNTPLTLADDGDIINLLGGKGAGLVKMSEIGLPVPPGFTITTEVCNQYYINNNFIDESVLSQVHDSLKDVEKELGKEFGSSTNPLLLSVRSGARESMPGMMDTILNIGLNDKTASALAKQTNNPKFAYDCYRRLIQMYSSVVLEIEHHVFEDLLSTLKLQKGYLVDSELDENDLKDLIKLYHEKIIEHGKEFPQDLNVQLVSSIEAVFKSWNNDRAKKYREIYHIPNEWGTAVNIQCMVFGNMGSDCATGVCFTRNPSTGDKEFYGEFLPNAQGEDVVAGIRTPHQITNSQKEYHFSDKESLEEMMPDVFSQLLEFSKILEEKFKDMQDIEFTIESGKLWILQCRNGKRSAISAVKIAIDMVSEGILTKEEAILKVDASSLDQLLHPSLDLSAKSKVISRGLPASPGAASGKVVFNTREAEKKSKENKVILVRNETSPEDISGMNIAQGILTVHGGMTSHAAVVARGMGKPCITGASGIYINQEKQQIEVSGTIIKSGDVITINGSNGDIMLGATPTLKPTFSKEFHTLMHWADDIRTLKVRANADNATDALTALQFGAEGIGLCRTEHMFFAPERLVAIREMILANNPEQRKIALEKLLPFQKEDFIKLYETMDGLPVTIRLLDPPLHEFLPKSDDEIRNLATELKVSVDWIKNRVSKLHESNPMLGHRGCRLAITFPEIYDMQVQAIIEAAVESESNIEPEIMIPLIIDVKEFQILKARIRNIAKAIFNKTGRTIKYTVGTMVELPRAALKSDEIAIEVDFFSFGTNDLTQSTMGISRDDSASFLPEYITQDILKSDPFLSLDSTGVGQLIEIAVDRGIKAKPDIKLGICGEHGGDPKSIEFFHNIGLHYVSCSPYRVAIARLAAAQAAIKTK